MLKDESPQFGRYQILERLGKGGMGVIYKAHDSQLDRVVAVKTILPEFLASDEVKERLVREAQAAARLQHPNVVTIYDIGEAEDGRLYFAMEYVRGRSLREIIPQRLPLERRLEIMADICKALGFAHRHGIVHRDVKPTNVLLADDGTVKLFDFGIAHLAGSSLTRTGVAIGTPEYMSPEMVEGGELDARSDIFSCGVMLYEMLTRNNPFRSDRITTTMYQIVHADPPNLRELRPNLPEDLERILRRMLAKRPEERYADMNQVVEDLEHIVSRGLLNKAIKAKELGDLMDQVEAKVNEAENDPRARQVLEEELAAPLGRRRRQVRKITKASDTSVTMTHIDRELISLREFDEKLDEFLERELPERMEKVSEDNLPTWDTPSEEPPPVDDTAATMRWEGDTTARQGMAAALAKTRAEKEAAAGQKTGAAQEHLQDSATGTPPPPPPQETPAEESGSFGQQPEARPDPTVVVPTGGDEAFNRRWMLPVGLLAALVLVVVTVWAVMSMGDGSAPQGEEQLAQSTLGTETDPAQQGDEQASDPAAPPQEGAGSGGDAAPAQPGGSSGGSSPPRPRGQSAGIGQDSAGTPSRPATPSPQADRSGAEAASAADGSQAQSDFIFQVVMADARKTLIPGNRDCQGTLEVDSNMFRFRSDDCTSRTLVRSILQQANLEDDFLSIEQVNGRWYHFFIEEEDRPRMLQALQELGW
ncbi:MAG TPA: protein kinase [Acidobacteriota bacterium]|nr:protein kinase [Acidobacteriota bacterium]